MSYVTIFLQTSKVSRSASIYDSVNDFDAIIVQNACEKRLNLIKRFRERSGNYDNKDLVNTYKYI